MVMRLTAEKVLLDQSMLAGESWSCRFVAGSNGAGHCGIGSAFVPQIALLIAAAATKRRVLANGRPATSQLVRLISMTAISVLSCSNAVKDRLRSLGFGMGRSVC
jgi:hypothetical protein